MKYKLNYFIFSFLSVLFLSCDRPKCSNENEIFASNEPNSKIYKDELIHQLSKVKASELTFWLQKYDNKNGKETLYFNIQGGGLCAILHLTVKNWNKLKSVRERKGVGRRGAEFTNLKFQIKQDSLSTEFIYTTFDNIID